MGLLIGITVAAAGATFLMPPIPQDPAYHRFADDRTFLGIPNFGNVVSNLAFIVVGVAGLATIGRRKSPRLTSAERIAFQALFFGAIGIGLGSAYYHWAPDNDRLVWDRLPMTILFMSFVAVILSERLSPKPAIGFFIFLVSLGASSVYAWWWSEAAGAGDLRFYGFIQFYPILLIPATLYLFPSVYAGTGRWLSVIFLLYGAAKLAEMWDGPILTLGNLGSGHTLKHLLAAGAVEGIRQLLKRRLDEKQEA